MRAGARRLRGCLGIVLFLSTGWLAAAPAPWPAAQFQYFSKQFPLSKVLTDFSLAFGLRLELSPQVSGTVTGDYSAATPTEFLNALASAYGLTWYYYGGVLYVDKASESVSKTLRVGRGEIATLKHALESLGIFEPRFGWGEFAERGMVLLSGPPSYVKLVTLTVEGLGTIPSGEEEMRVFPLTHARAEDRTFAYRDQQVNTPGVASILRNLVRDTGGTGRFGTNSLTTSNARPMAGQLASQRGQAAVGANAGSGGNASGRAEGELGNDANAPGGADRPASSSVPLRRAVIEADQRLNAVIVRDVPQRMAAYESLIRQLDVPTPLIEIEAMIIGVNSDQLDTLGVNWAARMGGLALGFGDPTSTSENSQLTVSQGRDINRSNPLAGNSSFFLAQINALATRGQARIMARPSVLTVDNLVAVLDLSETFYVRVTGERVADLVPISTGTLLKVTPRLINENGQPSIQLVVDIQDGQVQQRRSVDALPTVTQSNISTQAVIRESESLLIGGYSLDSQTGTKERVPLLGDVPLLGMLFRNETGQVTRRERLFLIRPHLVENPAARRVGQASAAPLESTPAAGSRPGVPPLPERRQSEAMPMLPPRMMEPLPPRDAYLP